MGLGDGQLQSQTTIWTGNEVQEQLNIGNEVGSSHIQVEIHRIPSKINFKGLDALSSPSKSVVSKQTFEGFEIKNQLLNK